jgi:hypothetical protein
LKRRREKIGSFLLAAATLKAPLGIGVYGNALMPILGGVGLFRDRRIDPLFLPLWGMGLVNFIPLIWHEAPAASYLRLIQFLLLVGFAQYLVGSTLLRGTGWLGTVALLYVLFLGIEVVLFPSLPKNTLRYQIFSFRYAGAMGDANFSAFLAGTVFWLGILVKKRGVVWLSLILLPFFNSRGAWLALGMAGGLGVVLRSAPRLGRIVAVLVFCGVVGYPLWIGGISRWGGDGLSERLNQITSWRYALHQAYGRLGLERPLLGWGYFNARSRIEGYLSKTALQSTTDPTRTRLPEQHSVYLQVFSDFGAVGYALFVFFLWRVFRVSARAGPAGGALWCYVMTGLLFLNGLGEWAFWVPAAVILKGDRNHAGVEKRGDDLPAEPALPIAG